MRLIDADRLKDSFLNCATLGGLLGEAIDKIVAWAIKIIDDAPTIEERPKGKWNEWEDERWGGVWYYCSNCHYDALYKRADGTLAQVLSDFCPTCGADMRGDV